VNYFLVIILVILVGTYLLEVGVEVLNLRHYDEDQYRKSQEYLKDSTRLEIIIESLTIPVTIGFILFGGFNWVDQFVRGFHLDEIPTGLLFTGTLLLAGQILFLPFSIYSTFVIEERYGLNKTTPKTFVLDILKGWLLTAVLGGILLSLVLWFFGRTGSWAWFYCWVAVILFELIVVFVAPVTIFPLFNKFVPLEQGLLREAIEAYARSQQFKLKDIFTMDGSKRSVRTNAFFTGFGKFRRIVLYDTLIEKHTEKELVCILAHEMGHYKKRHLVKSGVISVVTTGLMFYILSLFTNNRELFDAFKMEETSIYGSLFFFGFLYSPIMMVLSIFGKMLSRRHEYEADRYAVETCRERESMILALKKLSVDNLSDLTPHPLKVFLSYSHLPPLELIKAIRKIHLEER
jgi:STE24 endopeptidase